MRKIKWYVCTVVSRQQASCGVDGVRFANWIVSKRAANYAWVIAEFPDTTSVVVYMANSLIPRES